MSVATWRAEFYPVPASQCPPEQMLDQSILKYQGCRKSAMHRHDVRLDGMELVGTNAGDTDRLNMGSPTCAICHFHLPLRCETCPVYVLRGGTRCDDPIAGEPYSPVSAWFDHGDPEPALMILEALKSAQG